MGISKIKNFALLGLLYFVGASAQDEWWYEKHGFTDYRDWYYNVTFTPGHMGPFSFHIPELNAKVNPHQLEIKPTSTFGKGRRNDNNFAVGVEFEYVLAQKAELFMRGHFYESFNADTETMHYRMAIDTATSGTYFGDIHFGLRYQLLTQSKHKANVLLEFDWKAKTGQGERQALHTGAPGYHIALHAGKNLWNESFTIKTMMGFYVYQLSHMYWRQNDAFLFGLGGEYRFNSWELSSDVSGFVGYFTRRIGEEQNKDQPLIWRNKLSYQSKNILRYEVGVEHGIHHYPFTLFSFGIAACIP